MNGKFFRLLSVLACAAALVGCDHAYPLVWSPDGNTMAVIAEDGLRLGDPQGHLTAPSLTNANLIAWLPDSRRLLAATSTHVPSWAQAKLYLSPEQQKAALDLAARMKAALQRGGEKDLETMATVPSWQSQSAILYLKETEAPFLTASLSKESQRAVAGVTLEIDSALLVQAKPELSSDTKEVWRGFGEIEDMRVSPNGKFALVVHHDTADTDLYDIELASLDLPSPAVTVAQSATGHAAWSADSKQAVFFTGSHQKDEPKWVGSLATMPLVNNDGTPVKSAPDVLALLTTAIDRGTQVSGLNSGSYVFSGAEIQLPATKLDLTGVDNLFTFKPGDAVAQRVMPRMDALSLRSMGSLQVSPSGDLAAIGRADGEELDIVNLANGRVDHLQMDSKFDPCWRNNDEVCYTRPVEKKSANQHEWEVILHSLSTGQDRVISADWPRSAVMGFLIKKPTK